MFPRPVSAQSIRINPTAWYYADYGGYIAVRFEVLGCDGKYKILYILTAYCILCDDTKGPVANVNRHFAELSFNWPCTQMRTKRKPKARYTVIPISYSHRVRGVFHVFCFVFLLIFHIFILLIL